MTTHRKKKKNGPTITITPISIHGPWLHVILFDMMPTYKATYGQSNCQCTHTHTAYPGLLDPHALPSHPLDIVLWLILLICLGLQVPWKEKKSSACLYAPYNILYLYMYGPHIIYGIYICMVHRYCMQVVREVFEGTNLSSMYDISSDVATCIGAIRVLKGRWKEKEGRCCKNVLHSMVA